MQRTFLGIILWVGLSIGACGSGQRDRSATALCRGGGSDVKRVWNSDVKKKVQAAIARVDLSYANYVGEQVTTQIDGFANSWMMQKQSLCKERVMGTVTKVDYDLRSACYDSALLSLQAYSAYLSTADPRIIDNAHLVPFELSVRLDECRKEVFWRAYQQDLEVADSAALTRAKKIMAEANAAIALGKITDAERASVEIETAARSASSKRLKAEALELQGFLDIYYDRLNEGIKKMRRVIELFEEIEDPISGAATKILLGWYYVYKGRQYEKALKYYRQARETYKTHLTSYDENWSELWIHFGEAWKGLGEYEKAIDYYNRSLDLMKKIYGHTHFYVADILNDIGLLWQERGNNKKAIEYFEQAMIINKKVNGDEHPNVALRLNYIGIAWDSLGRHQKAIENYKEAIAINTNSFGDIHPLVAVNLNNIGKAWENLQDYKKAIEYYGQSLEIKKKCYGKTHMKVAASINKIAVAWAKLGEREKATGYFEEMVALKKKISGEDYLDVGITLHNIAMEWRRLGEYNIAIGYFERSIAICKGVDEWHPLIALSLSNIGDTLYDVKQYKKALGYYEDALKRIKPYNPEDHPLVKKIESRVDDCVKELNKL
ncbi:MAG: tetratricopeptide repeat protein [Myxococcota bacterium]|nr:tetratricopeptide repeat protein [Myxococcota bacterium]